MLNNVFCVCWVKINSIFGEIYFYLLGFIYTNIYNYCTNMQL